MIPLMINTKHLLQIFEPEKKIEAWTEEQIEQYSIEKQMYPSRINLTSETYSRDADRTSDYEMEHLTIINRKTKPEFTWNLIRADYVQNLLAFLKYTYGFKNGEGIIIPVKADDISISYKDFTGMRTINSYLGQTLEGELVEHNGILYWEDFRIGFPEK